MSVLIGNEPAAVALRIIDAGAPPAVVDSVDPVHPAGPAHSASSGDAATGSVGMAIALGAVTMTFATLLLAYAIVRVQAPTWPPPGEPPVPRAWSWLGPATLAALFGSGAMGIARRNLGVAASNQRRLRRALVGAAAAGMSFVGIQLCGWRWLVSTGIRPSSGMVASVVYALTLFHALHALAAVLALSPILLGAFRGRVVRPPVLRALSSFWHLVTIIWVVVFLAVFVA